MTNSRNVRASVRACMEVQTRFVLDGHEREAADVEEVGIQGTVIRFGDGTLSLKTQERWRVLRAQVSHYQSQDPRFLVLTLSTTSVSFNQYLSARKGTIAQARHERGRPPSSRCCTFHE